MLPALQQALGLRKIHGGDALRGLHRSRREHARPRKILQEQPGKFAAIDRSAPTPPECSGLCFRPRRQSTPPAKRLAGRDSRRSTRPMPTGSPSWRSSRRSSGTAASTALHFAALRYFNACGALPGRGEAHQPESHLIPLVLKVALGQKGAANIYGTDYPTPGRHLHPGLYPHRRPGLGAPAGAGSVGRARPAGLQPRQRQWVSRCGR